MNFSDFDNDINSCKNNTCLSSNGHFLFASQMALLTYPGHLDKIMVEEKISSSLKNKDGSNKKIKQIVIAHESADPLAKPTPDYKGPHSYQIREHTHVLIKWWSRVQITNPLVLECGAQVPHYIKIQCRKDYYSALRYVSKEDPSLKNMVNSKPKQEQTESSTTENKELKQDDLRNRIIEIATAPSNFEAFMLAESFDEIPTIKLIRDAVKEDKINKEITNPTEGH